MKKLFLVLILSVMLIAVASSSQAACNVSGILKTLNYTTAGVTVYVGNSGAASYYYYFTTANTNYYHVLSGLLGKNVGINGSATSCPITGVYRPGGVISTINAWH